MKVQRDGRSFTVEVAADGEGLVSHAGSALLGQVADKTGLSKALGQGLAPMRERRSGHDPGRVVRDLAVMLADGGEALFGPELELVYARRLENTGKGMDRSVDDGIPYAEERLHHPGVLVARFEKRSGA